MPQINDPDNLKQGGATNSTAVTMGAPTGRQLTMTSAATLPAVNAGDFFEIRNSPDTVNNGLWVEDGGTPTTSSITASKVSGAAPIAGGPDTLDFLGNTTEVKNIMYDTAGRGVYLVEKNGLGADGVLGQTVYSHMMISWKDDAFLIAHAPFPMLMIDADAGKALMGQDASGNNNGWNFVDDSGNSIRTRKLIRSMGWSELDSSGNTLNIYFAALTLGSFEDQANDTAYYQLGDDTTVDDTVDFDFAGPVNEAVRCVERLVDGSINGGTGVTIDAAGRVMTRSDGGDWRTDGFLVGGRVILRDSENSTNDGSLGGSGFGTGAFLLSAVGAGVDGAITMGTPAVATPNGFDFVDGAGGNDQINRNDGGSWLTEGYFVGGSVTVANATTVANDGTYTILAVTATDIDVVTASLTADTDDNTATIGPLDPAGSPDTAVNAAIDNRNQVTLRLRVRDGDPNGKTFDQSGLVRAGETILANRIIKFPLANATDLKISETDANIDANVPYTGMTLDIHSTPQSLGGGGILVGGPYNFGFTVECNAGTSVEVHEWASRQLRKLTDIDADADTAIGRAIDALTIFVGDAMEGGIDSAGNFPRNPQGGGSGVFLQNSAAASKNTTTMYDNTGTKQSFPIGTPVTLDFNQTLIDDTLAEYTLFFDWTIKTNVSDLIVTAGAGANGTFDSVGANLPAVLDVGVGAYVRLQDYTGADAPMNGIYQVTALTSTSQWNVTRLDGVTIVTTASAANDIDEHPVDSPDAVIVQSDVPANVQGLASADFAFTFAWSTNVQGGRTAATDAFVVARALGQQSAQFTQSTVATIPSATATTIPLVAQIERSFNNP